MSPKNALLQRGNSKLGERIHTWSLPAVSTCPGKSAACAACYASHGFYQMPNVRARLARNLEASKAPDFVRRMTAELARRKVRVCRLHVSGDFYGVSYTRGMLHICKRSPDVRFYAYSRSWRVPAILPELAELASLKNVRLWFSTDDDTGLPSEVPKGVRIAYLQTVPITVAVADLIFRVQALRSAPTKRIGLTVVCPVENGGNNPPTCSTCKICWK